MQITENDKQAYKMELASLISDNPELEIMPMVNGECCYDACEYTQAQIGAPIIDEYIICPAVDHIYFKSQNFILDAVEDFYTDTDTYETLPSTEEELRPMYDALPWVKAIILPIESFR